MEDESDGNGGSESEKIRDAAVNSGMATPGDSTPTARTASGVGAVNSSPEDRAKNVCAVEQCWALVFPLSDGLPPSWWWQWDGGGASLGDG